MSRNSTAQIMSSIATKHNLSAEKLVEKLVVFLEKHALSTTLPQIKNALTETQKLSFERETLTIRSRYSILEAEIDDIKALVGASHSTETQKIVDESVLGGFIAEYNGVVYDGSLAHQVAHLKDSLAHAEL